MKNNKGFTLIEVLAVVAILITVIAIITPKIFKHFKTAENVTDQEQINTLINTSKIYMNQNTNLLPEENDLYVISLSELKESGLIQTSQILNPSTKEELTGCILVKYENNKYKYEYKEDECDKITTLTFDPNGGQVNQTSKRIISNEPYGKLPTPTRNGYTFVGWSTSPTDEAIIYDENEYYGTLAADSTSQYKEIKEYVLPAPFQPGEVYQLDVDVKGEGDLLNYFYGTSDYLKIKMVEVESTDETVINQYGDGATKIKLTNNYRHYTAKFTLSNNGDVNAVKKILFRIIPGNTAYIKNIKFTKISQSSTIYTENNILNKYEHNRILITYSQQSSADARDQESGYFDFLQLTTYAPFEENEIYQLDVDVKGEGTLKNYFYGDTGYLRVKKIETSQGETFAGGDGRNDITLTGDYQHYTATFTLGNEGDGNVDKALLFRVYPGNTAYIKNIEFKKIYPIEEESTPETNKTFYAIWKANE